MPVGQLQRLSQSQAFKPPDFRYWKIERAFAPKGLLSPGLQPREPAQTAPRPHKALLRCALEKNTRRARVGGAEGAPDPGLGSCTPSHRAPQAKTQDKPRALYRTDQARLPGDRL